MSVMIVAAAVAILAWRHLDRIAWLAGAVLAVILGAIALALRIGRRPAQERE